MRETLASGLHAYYDISTTPHVFDITADIVNNITRFAIVFDNSLPKMAAPTADFKVIASPNPFVSGFQLNVNTILQEPVAVRVYDVLGKLVEMQTLTVAELQDHVFATTVSAGFYTAIISQGSNKEIIKVIKK